MIRERKAEKKEVTDQSHKEQAAASETTHDNLTDRLLWNPDKYSGVGKFVGERVVPFNHRQPDGWPGQYI